MSELAVIIDTAYKIRERVTKFAKEINREYYLDPEGLMGCCAISSVALKYYTKNPKLKIIEGIVNGSPPPTGAKVIDYINHCWNEYEGQIIDITATQFWHDVDKVYVTDSTNKDYLKLRESKDLRSFKGWCIYQRPTKDVLRKIIEEL
jgi:hypothetical protein